MVTLVIWDFGSLPEGVAAHTSLAVAAAAKMLRRTLSKQSRLVRLWLQLRQQLRFTATVSRTSTAESSVCFAKRRTLSGHLQHICEQF